MHGSFRSRLAPKALGSRLRGDERKRKAPILAAAALCLTLSACATPYVQPPLTPPQDFAGAGVDDRFLLMDDGARLPLLRWSLAQGEPWAVIVALHGMNDHDASFRLAGPWWAEQGVETWAYDQRGFGQAPGRGRWAGEARMTEDLRTAVALARAAHPRAIVAVVGESMGGSVATAAFGSDRPPDADRVVLLAPGVWGWSSQGWLNSAALSVAARMAGGYAAEAPDFIARRIRASDNELELIRNGRDPDSILATRFDAIYGLVGLMETASRRLGDIRTPAILMYGAHDQIVKPGPMKRALERLPASATLRTAWYPDGWHLLNRDLQAEVVYRDVLAFLRAPDGSLPSGATPVLPHLEDPASPQR
ncbi:alpha/beta fold hydrolase [Brevundimonas sp. PAMC22021]|uniref:alpha/beta fold hydrolase n=1 Tax=Brevundimonas sp. PAMC22021 TaxID=2861285 RepID=UPI001C633760|nr:alpha/beta fold hydrolase [Brevundimonas sp. PAMC22021]QYF87334.1 lysophospholipase [Brevundimonas sp. PAMC22021]